jgi:energy-coupling factor transport system permease protein
VAFGVFNAAVDVTELVRAVPPSLRDVGLVVSVALAFVPCLLAAARDVRDAQRLRGERALRLLAPSLVVPVLGFALERALLLAESMDSRGYGRAAPARRLAPLALPGLAAMTGGMALWVGARPLLGVALVAGGAGALAAAVRASRAPVTRLRRVRPRPRDALAALAAGCLAAAWARDAAYAVYPAVHPPGFTPLGGAAVLLLAAPALAP